ncbi:MAG TPA: sulfurtransferase-like selenium metabolism protein YedF [Bacillota bacterium]|jgi:selenium metabolism protein YedF|nr:sulfurtransferase-like selenium metabolism protein YedF [Fastidiosipila sp.]HPX92604.1 sulfurtransferase-like selenium metabolism protein YedF [Bacillota bacterium]HQB81128.1 sulfurtransferase-like selenium metabolism protein YedF [Bacillota bacterium]
MKKETELVILISSDTMGQGSPELGQILIKSYLATLDDLPRTPDCLLFINAGVRLTTKDSTVLEDLRTLECKGTRLLSCGTCLNYFELGEPEVGSVSNMQTLSEVMASAKRLICL